MGTTLPGNLKVFCEARGMKVAVAGSRLLWRTGAFSCAYFTLDIADAPSLLHSDSSGLLPIAQTRPR
ncbi:hypothetical protein AALO_G00272210 [Alosa alosa]|uniref:Uncharacterized protein n=1 Tax=Alosa alosa TaxID=278164 RepID=A0AAV6FQX3_9TELE|nr:hypothetical protein AALO_G00272210 [Alosa alosa]